jgi:hypothetical protein
VRLLEARLLMLLHTIGGERIRAEPLRYNVLFRWLGNAGS